MEYRMTVGVPEEASPGDSKPIGFILRELERICSALQEPQSPDRSFALYAAQQALTPKRFNRRNRLPNRISDCTASSILSARLPRAQVDCRGSGPACGPRSVIR